MKLKRYSPLLLALCLSAQAQESTSSFNALRLPTSSHVAALGGQNVTLVEDSPAAGWANPALYANTSDLSLGLDFMTYFSSTTWMGAQFVKAVGDRHTVAVNAHYMNYGQMDETDASGNVTGRFGAKDITIGGGYSYLLSDRWTGGANLKFMFSNLASYSAIAMAVDLGVNYYDADADLSLSATMQNIGIQLKAYDETVRTHLPFSVNLGLTKGLNHLPARIHLTMVDLNRWKTSDYAIPSADGSAPSFTRKALNHIVVGLDILPTDQIYLSLGYNFRRAYELKAAGSSHLAGLSAGGGINLSRFQLGISYARYHQASSSLMVTAGYKL